MNLDVIVGVGGTIAAVAVSQWPRIAPLLRRPAPPANGTTPAPVTLPSFHSALESLASVRTRLVACGGVTDEASKAIETLTLALMQGSDR